MKLSKKSWHYRLNMWYTWSVPKNLCSYFWRTVWYLLILPITLILFIPRGILWLFSKKRSWDGFIEEYLLVLTTNTALGLLFCMIIMFWHWAPSERDPWGVIFTLGCVGWVILTLAGIVWVVEILQERSRSKGREEKKPSLLREYLRAKKNKYCPKIEWE